MGTDCNSKSNDFNITIIFIILLQWNPINMVTNGPKKFGGNNEVTVLMMVSLQENVSWSFLLGGQKKMAVIMR